MFEFSVGALLIGAVILTFSLKPLHDICGQSSAKGWCLLRLLVVFFILGYLGYLGYLLTEMDAVFADGLVSAIMLGGSIFVILVTHYSRSSLIDLNTLMSAERHNALHDNLTQLPNRQYFHQHLLACQQSGLTHYLCLLDLNSFKQINDGLGHYFGDQLLRKIALRLSDSMNDQLKAFRIGGDEFAVVVECESTDKFDTIMKSLRQQTFGEDFVLDGYELSVNVSVGAMPFRHAQTTIDELLKKVDLALHQNKFDKTPYSLFDEKLETDAAEKLHIASKLKTALANEELEVWYQPIIDAQTKKTVSVEALIRWPQADGSFIPPDKFIAVAEQDTTINAITQFVLSRVATDVRTLRAQGLNFDVHVNLSVRDIQFSGLIDQLEGLMSSDKLSAGDILFEITESAMMTNVKQAKNTMASISTMGYVFSVDDFGTGFSSLSMLRHLPIDQIKIDRSFVNKLENKSADLAIVKSTIFLAKNLGCSVVAEGVETQACATMLQELGCDYLQGYLYSRPLPLDAFLASGGQFAEVGDEAV